MNGRHFPALAGVLGLIALAVVLLGRAPGADGGTALPLFTLLATSEFAFIVCAIGAVLGARRIAEAGFAAVPAVTTLGCALLAVAFAVLGIGLWPG